MRRNALPALFAALAIVHGSAEAADYSGRARVIDGDTISIRNQRIRIAAIDACERDQTGLKDGKLWRCGVAARSYLGKMIDGQHVRCDIIDQDQYRRLVGECFIGDVDIGLAMVKAEDWRRQCYGICRRHTRSARSSTARQRTAPEIAALACGPRRSKARTNTAVRNLPGFRDREIANPEQWRRRRAKHIASVSSSESPQIPLIRSRHWIILLQIVRLVRTDKRGNVAKTVQATLLQGGCF